MINREATIRWKGYDPDDLSPGSGKKVWANCDICGHGRWVRRNSCADLCKICSQKIVLPTPKFVLEKDRFILETGIDRIITIKERGYDPADLSPNSQELVWCICQGCEKGRWLTNRSYHDLCVSCAKIVNLPEPGFVPEEDRFIPGTGIDRIKTIEEMGYDPAGLSEKARRKVWCICQKCGNGRLLPIASYRDLCFDCISGKPLKPEYVPEDERFVFNTYIDRIKTIEKFGYDPTDLKSGSVRKIWVVCKKCGKERCSTMNDYRDLCVLCSKKRGVEHPNWKGGISGSKYCEKFNEVFKEMIRELFDRRCFLCGITEEEIGRHHDVHHVNYDKDCLCNSNCEFVPLCRSCHIKTNFKRKYWEDLIMCYLHSDRIIVVDL